MEKPYKFDAEPLEKFMETRDQWLEKLELTLELFWPSLEQGHSVLILDSL